MGSSSSVANHYAGRHSRTASDTVSNGGRNNNRKKSAALGKDPNLGDSSNIPPEPTSPNPVIIEKEYFQSPKSSYAQGEWDPTTVLPNPFEGDASFDFLRPPDHPHEEKRLDLLWSYAIMDTDFDLNFDRIVQVAKEIFEVPICLVSLIDDSRQWFKAAEGLSCRETGRDISFCGHAILLKKGDVLVVEDAMKDWRFRNNPLVTGDPFIRFYAGGPLRTRVGLSLGTLCLIDTKPRRFSKDDVRRLETLAAVVVREMELWKASMLAIRRAKLEESVATFTRQSILIRNLAEILNLCTEAVAGSLGADVVTLVTTDPKAPDLAQVRCLCRPITRQTSFGAQSPASGRQPATKELPVVKVVESSTVFNPANNNINCPVFAFPPEIRHYLEDMVRLPEMCKGFLSSLQLTQDVGHPFLLNMSLSAMSCNARKPLPEMSADFLRTFLTALSAVMIQNHTHEVLLQRERDLLAEKVMTDRLLQNIFPRKICEGLLTDFSPVASSSPCASILFADIVGFTALSADMEAEEVVDMLNRLFSQFDLLAVMYGIEKIKTIGDAYMVAAGIPDPRADHAEVLIEMSIAMFAAIEEFNQSFTQKLQIRIGVSTGPVVAGVIGLNKFIYDLWGDTVNMASRMESTGIPGRLQVSESTYDFVKDLYKWECREGVYIKGKGDAVITYLLSSRGAQDRRTSIHPDKRLVEDLPVVLRKSSLFAGAVVLDRPAQLKETKQ